MDVVITLEGLFMLGTMNVHPLVNPVEDPDLEGCICIGCWKTYACQDVVVSDNGHVCLNCLKALADSYFDAPA